MHLPVRTAAAALLATCLVACGSDPAGPPDDDDDEITLPMEFTFDSSQEGWLLLARLPGDGSGTASYDGANGRIILSGYGEPGEPDAWMSRKVTLPDVELLWIDVLVTADCLMGGSNDSHARLTVTTEDNTTTVVDDWSKVDETPNLLGGLLEPFRGQTVTITIEQDDEGDQQSADDPESVCVDNVKIFEDN